MTERRWWNHSLKIERAEGIGRVNLAGPWKSGDVEKGRKVVEKDVKDLVMKRNT